MLKQWWLYTKNIPTYFLFMIVPMESNKNEWQQSLKMDYKTAGLWVH